MCRTQRTILGNFNLSKAAGSRNPGSESVRASCSGNGRSPIGDECLNPGGNHVAAVVVLSPAEKFPDPGGKMEAKIALPRGKCIVDAGSG